MQGRAWQQVVAALVLGILAGCSRSPVALQPLPRELLVTVAATERPSYGELEVTLDREPEVTLQIHASTSHAGVARVRYGSLTPTSARIYLEFWDPRITGAGTFTDELTVEVCLDDRCERQVPGSPQVVNITYQVVALVPVVSSVTPALISKTLISYTGTVGLLLSGSNFLAASVALWNGHARPTAYIDHARLMMILGAEDLAVPATMPVQVSNDSFDGGRSNVFEVRVFDSSAPVPNSLSPSVVKVGGPAFTLTVGGSNFNAQSIVLWAGSPRPTTFVSEGVLEAAISAADVAAVGDVAVSVSNAATMGGTAAAGGVRVSNPPTPHLFALTPTFARVGDPPFALRLSGWDFDPTSVVRWNGAARATTYLSPAELTAEVTAEDLAAEGPVTIDVASTTPPFGASAVATLEVRPRAFDAGTRPTNAVGFQLTPVHTGQVAFAGLSFPAGRIWRVELGGLVGYPLIADGKVAVVVNDLGGHWRLVVLKQDTGAFAWVSPWYPGAAFAASDHGMVFVSRAAGGRDFGVSAFDLATGELRWASELVALPAGRLGGITAGDGRVYALAASMRSMLVALNQTSGQTLWTQDVPFGGPAAITADGVFVGDGCQTSRLDPATGAVWWTSGSPCLDQGTWTPVVSAGEIYAAPSGRRLDADGGAQVGNLATDAPPAIGPELGFFRQGNSLSGVSLLDGGTLWTYTADAGLVGPPLGVNEFAIIASPSGRVIALDGRTGAEAWTQDLGAPISDYQPGGWGQAPSFGLAAGDGLLVVPASFTLTAFTLSSSP